MICKVVGLAVECTVAFGDGENDKVLLTQPATLILLWRQGVPRARGARAGHEERAAAGEGRREEGHRGASANITR